MEKNLRHRFIFTAMLSVFVVLSTILIIINVNNYQNYKDISLAALENYDSQPLIEEKPSGINSKINSEIRIVVYDKVTKTFNDPLISIFEPNLIDEIETIENSEELSGSVDSIFFKVDADNIYLVNATREYTMYTTFRNTSIIVSFISLFIVYILLVFTSKSAVAPIVEAYEKQKKFITNASHELKTPLSVIRTNNEVMEMDFGQNPYIKSTEHQIVKLTELVNALVSLSKLDEDFKLNTQKMDLEKIVKDVVSDYEIVSDVKKHPFDLKLDKIIEPIDETLFRQLVAILLDNAMKYAADESSIRIVLNKNILSFENDAVGLSNGDHPEVFERFYTKDISHNSKISGHGIGLSLAKQITELHQMKIGASVNDNNFKIIINF